MTESDQGIFERVRGIFDDETLSKAIVYLSQETVHAGTQFHLGDALIEVPWEAQIAFIDLEPQANWGHACAYLALRSDGEEILRTNARMSPFLKPGETRFRLLWKGALAPEWAIATE